MSIYTQGHFKRRVGVAMEVPAMEIAVTVECPLCKNSSTKLIRSLQDLATIYCPGCGCMIHIPEQL